MGSTLNDVSTNNTTPCGRRSSKPITSPCQLPPAALLDTENGRNLSDGVAFSRYGYNKDYKYHDHDDRCNNNRDSSSLSSQRIYQTVSIVDHVEGSNYTKKNIGRSCENKGIFES